MTQLVGSKSNVPIRELSVSGDRDHFGCALLDHLELENGVYFPRGRAPWTVEFVVTHKLYLWTNRSWAIVEIVPHQITGHPNFARRMSRRLVAVIREANESS